MKIALIRLPGTYANWFKGPSLGLSYLSAIIEKNNYQCKIFDALFNSWSEEQLIQQVTQYKPDIVGITAMTHEIVKASQIGTEIKKQLKIPLIIGGCHTTALPKRTLTEFPVFDYGVYGEGEKTIVELLEYFKKGKKTDLNKIKGMVYRKNGKIMITEPRPFLTQKELDKLPYPAFHQYYGKNPDIPKHKGLKYPMMTSRGCPYNCAFCMRVLGQKIRRRSADKVCEEIEYAISKYGIRSIWFTDEIFLSNNRETKELLELMIKKDFPKKITWGGLVRANLVTTELIKLAKKAGCQKLEMGIESGDDEILKGICKGITVEQVKKAVKILKKEKIMVGTYYILGHPNENRKTIKKTIDLATKLNTESIAVGLMVPYPGTKIYNMALKGEGGYRLLTEDWSEFDKYGAKSLELKGLPYSELVKWQRRAFINLYLKNLRFRDAFKFFWKHRHGFSFLIKKKFSNLKHNKKSVKDASSHPT